MVWIKPEELFVGQTFWSNEYQNPYFILQRRKGHGPRDSHLCSILYHVENDDMEVSIVIAVGVDRKEIQENWDWLEKTLLPTLESFENEEDTRRFVLTKIEGLVKVDETALDEISSSAILQRFQTLFEMPPEEKLVNYYSCTYWRGRKPHQGKMYLSVNFMCFYSFLVGSQMKIKIRWTEITKLDTNTSLLLPQGFTIVTRDGTFDFSMFMNFNEAYRHTSQLLNLAMRQLIEEEGFSEDPILRHKFMTEGQKTLKEGRCVFCQTRFGC
uniref:GRAM domain-containing protein n=1 Tax=Ditylenchus dipsaci TaxID=166011 RepID=A0A915DDW1_9BILA